MPTCYARVLHDDQSPEKKHSKLFNFQEQNTIYLEPIMSVCFVNIMKSYATVIEL